MILGRDKYHEFVALWNDHTATGGYIREHFGISYKAMEALRLELGLPERPNKSHEAWEPTPEEIETRAREARARWTDARRLKSETGRSRRSVEIRQFSYDRKTMSFT